MTIAYLKSTNFKSIETIEIEFNGQSAIISGKNGIGKSSVIDAIMTTLTDLGTIKEPVKQGKTEGSNVVHILLDKDIPVGGAIMTAGTILVCERKFSKDGKNTLKVQTLQGTKFSKPKELLNAILGLTVIPDPSELIGMKPKEQQSFVMDFLKIDTKAIDDKIAAINQRIYDKGILLTAAQDGIPTAPIAAVVKPDIDPDSVDAMLFDISEYEKKIAAADNKISSNKGFILSKQNSISETQSEITRLSEKLVMMMSELKRYQDDEAALISTKEAIVKPAKTKEELKAVTPLLESYKQYTAKLAGIEDAKLKARTLSAEVAEARTTKTELNNEKQKVLSQNLPVEGLTFGDEGLLFKGLPITPDQMSESQQYELWMDILFAFNPNLRLVWFKHGSGFDQETQARILKKVEDHGYMAVIERVAEDETIQVHFIERSNQNQNGPTTTEV